MKFWIAAGAAFSLASMLFAGSMITAGPSVVMAGEDVCVTYTPTRTVTRTPTPGTPGTSTNTPIPSATNSPVPSATPDVGATETAQAQLSNQTRPNALYGSIYAGGVSGANSSGVDALGNETPRATCPTPTRTGTATVGASSTPVNTTVPATNTPTGGSQGGGVRPPDTGFGDGTAGTSDSLMIMGILAVIAVAGGGVVLAGARKRNR